MLGMDGRIVEVESENLMDQLLLRLLTKRGGHVIFAYLFRQFLAKGVSVRFDPLKTAKYQGKLIGNTGEPIVCLPHFFRTQHVRSIDKLVR